MPRARRAGQSASVDLHPPSPSAAGRGHRARPASPPPPRPAARSRNRFRGVEHWNALQPPFCHGHPKATRPAHPEHGRLAGRLAPAPQNAPIPPLRRPAGPRRAPGPTESAGSAGHLAPPPWPASCSDPRIQGLTLAERAPAAHHTHTAPLPPHTTPPPLCPPFAPRPQPRVTHAWVADPVCSPRRRCKLTATLHPMHPSTQWFQPLRIPRIHITSRETARPPADAQVIC